MRKHIKEIRKPTKEEEDFIRDNMRYDPETGDLWWIKLPEGDLGRKRDLDKPLGSYSNGYLILGLPKSLTGCSNPWYPKVHRVAWFLYYGFWPDDMLDHINGVKTDNRIKNLRIATHQENNRNRKQYQGFSSKYKGVTWHKASQKWLVRCNYKKRVYLGSYISEEDAARAYDKAAREYFGEYARLNFPEEHEQGALNGHDL